MASKEHAQQALNKMQRSLRSWLTYRQQMDDILVKGSPTVASVIAAYRDHDLERRMAHELYALLAQTTSPRGLPNPTAMGAAVKLAKIALGDTVVAPTTQGAFPVIFLVGTVVTTGLIVLAMRLSTHAQIAAEKERLAVCRETGHACPTDWTKVAQLGIVLGAGYYVMTRTELGARLRRKLGV